MSTMTHHETGMFCWTQIATTDVEGAKKFYSGLFGWKPEYTEEDQRGFTLLKKDGKALGALMEQPAGTGAPSWMSFVAVDDIDDTVARVRKHGGRILHEP